MRGVLFLKSFSVLSFATLLQELFHLFYVVVVSALSQVEVDVKVLIKSNQAKIKLPVEGQSWSWRRRGEFDLRGERYVLP